jgi:hypothetical protein
MKRLLIGAAFCALFAAPVAAEPVKLTSTQMDGLSAGACVFAICKQTQSNWTWQNATAVAVGGAAFSNFSGNATAVATNVNETEQEQEID